MLTKKIEKDFEIETAKQETQMLKQNLDASVIKFNAMKGARSALQSKEFKCASVKTQDNDLLNTVAASWLTNKQVYKE